MTQNNALENKKILIVEDSRIVAEDIKVTLEGMQYAVCGIVSRGEEILKIVRRDKPDLILMDIVLKGVMDGIESTHQIQSHFDIPIVFLTAYADRQTIEKIGHTTHYGYIVKPFDSRYLRNTIELALSKHKTEKKLRENEEWLHTTLKSIGDAVISTNGNGKINFMNPLAEALTGWDEKSAAGSPFSKIFRIIDQNTRQACENPVDMVRKTGATVGLANNTLLISKSGKETAIEDSATPIRGVNGDSAGAVVVFRDVTEKRRMQERLAEKQAKLSKAQRIVRMGFLDWNLKTNTVYWSDEIYSLFGLDPGRHSPNIELSRKLVHPEDRELVQKNIRDVIKEDKPYDLDYRILRPDGKVRWVHAQADLTRDADGNPLSLLGTLIDITRRKQAEENAAKAQADLAKTFNSLQDAILVFASETHEVVECNPAAENMFGYSREEFLGMKNTFFEQYLSMQEVSGKSMRSANLIKPPEMTEVPMKRKDGTVFTAEYTLIPLENDQNQQTGWINVVRDITKRKELEKQIIHSQKIDAIGTLSGGIVHEMNNILTPIIVHTEIVLGELPEESPLKNSLQTVIKASNRAREMINNILVFSRSEKIQLRPLQLGAIAKEACKLLRYTLPSTISIVVETEVRNDVFYGDFTQIHQVIINLCINAHHAMREKGGTLKIDLTKVHLDKKNEGDYPNLAPGTYLKLSVSDTGCGIDPSISDKIFNPYFTTKPQGVGEGMGLSMARAIVDSHKGALTFESEPGKGTVFDVFLPHIIGEVDTEPEAGGEIPTGTESVLLVDDEQILLDTLKPMLEKLGYQVTTRSASIEALELFRVRSDSFDLVITDQTMPNMTGAELAEKLFQIRPDIPVILCTGYSELIDEQGAEKIGIRAFLMKPTSRAQLAATIRETLDEPE